MFNRFDNRRNGFENRDHRKRRGESNVTIDQADLKQQTDIAQTHSTVQTFHEKLKREKGELLRQSIRSFGSSKKEPTQFYESFKSNTNLVLVQSLFGRKLVDL